MSAQQQRPQVGNSLTEKVGLSVVSEIVHKPAAEGGMGFLFRDLPTHDFGIDGQIEVVDEVNGRNEPTGRFVSVQVKSGPSFFRTSKNNGWIVPIRKSTVHYWRSHSVPVLLIIVDTENRKCFWTRADVDDYPETAASYIFMCRSKTN